MFCMPKAMLLQLKIYALGKSALIFRFFIPHFSLDWRSDL